MTAQLLSASDNLQKSTAKMCAKSLRFLKFSKIEHPEAELSSSGATRRKVSLRADHPVELVRARLRTLLFLPRVVNILEKRPRPTHFSLIVNGFQQGAPSRSGVPNGRAGRVKKFLRGPHTIVTSARPGGPHRNARRAACGPRAALWAPLF